MVVNNLPGIMKAESLKHGQLDCVVVEACRPIHTREEMESIAQALGIETQGRKTHVPHICRPESWGYRTSFYVGEMDAE